MAERVDRRVLLTVLATEKHCNNSCAGIDFTDNPQIARCTFFNEEMAWDERKQVNGYIRLSACKKAETFQSESTASDRWLEVVRMSAAEGRRIQGTEVALLLKEVDRLRANEVELHAYLKAERTIQESRSKTYKELRKKMEEVINGLPIDE